ncbi:MAG: hydrogenase subunit MbhD domain-containing protein [Peptococcaceae bacterium]|nr:hydrogenase subunit MbhD domain-containing protein [Peptococcaceae bacterium]
MKAFMVLILLFLIGCSLAVSLTKKLLTAVIIFMSYSLAMSIVWIVLKAPDLAVTEAAVGAGITSILFFLTLARIKEMKGEKDEASK